MAEYQELRKKEGKLLDDIEKDFTDLQLQIATQNNKKKSGKRKKKQEAIGAMMSNRIAHHYQQNNYSYNNSYSHNNQQGYNEYKKDTYHFKSGTWHFNKNAKSREVVTVQRFQNKTTTPRLLPPVPLM